MALRQLVYSLRSVASATPFRVVIATAGFASMSGAVAWMKLRSFVSAEQAGALHPKEFRRFKVRDVEHISHNTARYRFDLPSPDDVLGLTVASCLVVRAPIGENGKDVIRPYTPITLIDQCGFFELLVKTYPQGVMSKHIASLMPGDELEFQGPFKKIDVTPNMKHHIGMIAGGTGLTPMLQVVRELLLRAETSTMLLTLVFANVAEDDILLRDNLDKLAQKHSNFRVHYVLEKPPADWQGSVGYVTEDVIKKHLPAPSSDVLIMVCGPPPMMKAISGDKSSPREQGELEGLLKNLGYTKDMVFKF